MSRPKTWRQAMALALATLMLGGAVTLASAQDRGGHDRGDRGDRGAFRGEGRDRGFDRGDHRFFDGRYNHGRYYPERGERFYDLPGGYRTFYYGGRPYFFAGGAWYMSGPGGFVVAAPPFGLRVSVLPPFYTTVWLGGVPYYYADDVYYRWDAGLDAYEVVAPPPGADAPGAPPPAPAAASASGEAQLYIYPKNGQSSDQQAQDRYECHSWATNQTGYDPTRPNGGVSPDQTGARGAQYRRAMTACLEARGYSVQ